MFHFVYYAKAFNCSSCLEGVPLEVFKKLGYCLGIFPRGLSFRFGNLEFPSCVKTLLNWLPKASAFCLSSLIMFPAMLWSPIPWLSCLSLEMKLQNAFGFVCYCSC